MTATSKACTRCGWRRSYNARTPDLCAACRGSNERTEAGNDHIEWRTVGLIRRGTLHPPDTTRSTTT